MKFNKLNYLGTRWKIGTNIVRVRALGPRVVDAQISNIQKDAISIRWNGEKESYNYYIEYILNNYDIQ